MRETFRSAGFLYDQVGAGEVEAYRLTLIEIRTSIIAELRHQQHILEHLLVKRVREPGPSQDLLVHGLGQLLCTTALAIFCLYSLEVHDDLIWCVIICGTIDARSKHPLSVQQDRFDEFAGLVFSVKQWDGRVGGDRQSEAVGTSLEFIQHPAGDVGHVESWQEECRGQSDRADVFLNLGFGIEVGHLGELAAGDYTTKSVEYGERSGCTYAR